MFVNISTRLKCSKRNIGIYWSRESEELLFIFELIFITTVNYLPCILPLRS